MRKGRDDGIEFIEVPAKALDAATRRITPLVRTWATLPALSGLDLYRLAVSCYLQGTVDGMDCAERERRRRREKKGR